MAPILVAGGALVLATLPACGDDGDDGTPDGGAINLDGGGTGPTGGTGPMGDAGPGPDGAAAGRTPGMIRDALPGPDAGDTSSVADGGGDASVPQPDPECVGAMPDELAGDGTAQMPYFLCLPAHLTLVGDGAHGLNKVYALGDDLDVAGVSGGAVTLGGPEATFVGTLDGRGHRITGLTATLVHDLGADGQIANLWASGAVNLEDGFKGALVAGVSSGTIDNVHATVTAKISSHSAVLVGYNAGTVRGSSAHGTITDAGNHVGGLAGVNVGLIEASYSDVDVKAGNRVGGLVGTLTGGGKIHRSYALGAVEGIFSVGGLVGTLFEGEIVDCFARPKSVTGPQAGGLVGYAVGDSTDGLTRTIRNAYAIGPVVGANTHGLVGFLLGDPVVSVVSSYFDAPKTGTLGTALSVDAMKMQASYVNWDFTTVWQMDPATSPFPSLP